MDEETTCVNFTIERWYPVANMSRYLPIRIYDYYAPGNYILIFFLICIKLSNNFNLILILISERFNESIFDALPTYVLNICEVCGSSQCPYCSIYNAATSEKAVFCFVFFTALIVLTLNSQTRLFRLREMLVGL